MSILPGMEPNELMDNRRDDMLEMIFVMIEEAHQMQNNVLAASALSDHTVFEEYNNLSQLDQQIEALVQIRRSGKQRVQMHYFRQ
jgi:hypothetical protein